ncbi:MAG: tetratricopeptide repeat protein [Planctomycetota bacterium]
MSRDPFGSASSTPNASSSGVLPEATRQPKNVIEKGLTIPDDIQPNPDIPKPDYPGLADSLKREINTAYIDAIKAPNNADRVGDLGIVFLRMSSAGDAVKCFSRACQLDSKSLRWAYLLGVAHSEAFDNTASLTAFKKAVALDPDYHPVYLRMGDILLKEDAKSAQAHYQKAADLAPQDARAWYGLGECALHADRKSEAILHYKKATDLAPKFAKAQRMLAKLVRENGNRQQADIHDALADQGGLPPVVRDPIYLDYLGHVTRGDALVKFITQLIETSQLELAGSILQRTLQWEPQNWEFREQLGLVRWKQGRFEDAARELQVVLDENFSRTAVRGILAECLVEIGKYSEAEKVFNDVLTRNSDDADVLSRHGEFLLKVGRGTEAKSVFERLTVLQPESAQVVIDLIVALLCEKQYDPAAQRLKTHKQGERGPRDLTSVIIARIARIIADQADARERDMGKGTLGISDVRAFVGALTKIGLNEEARKMEDFIAGIARVAVALANGGDFGQALRILQRSMHMDEGGLLRDALRTVFIKLAKRDPKTSSGWLKDGIAHAEGQPLLSICLAWILSTSPDSALRDGATAVRLAESVCRSAAGETRESLDALAAAYAEVGRFDDAVKTAQKAVELAGIGPGAEPIKSRLSLYESKKPYHATN